MRGTMPANVPGAIKSSICWICTISVALFISSLVALDARIALVPDTSGPYQEGIALAREHHAAHAEYDADTWPGGPAVTVLMFPFFGVMVGSHIAVSCMRWYRFTCGLVLWIIVCLPSLLGILMDRAIFFSLFQHMALGDAYKSAFTVACFKDCNATGCWEKRVTELLEEGSGKVAELQAQLDTYPATALAWKDSALIAFFVFWGLFILQFALTTYCMLRWRPTRIRAEDDGSSVQGPSVAAVMAFLRQAPQGRLSSPQYRWHWKYQAQVSAEEHPQWFCPITKELMRIPVIVSMTVPSGVVRNVYEYKAIKKWWLMQHRRFGWNFTDPVSNVRLEHATQVQISVDTALQAEILRHLERIEETYAGRRKLPRRRRQLNEGAPLAANTSDVVIEVLSASQGAPIGYIQGFSGGEHTSNSGTTSKEE